MVSARKTIGFGLAGKEPAHVHMIHVVPNLEGEPALIRNALDGPGRRAAAEEALRKHLVDKGHPDVDVLVRGGAAGEVIAEGIPEVFVDLFARTENEERVDLAVGELAQVIGNVSAAWPG